jgi:hypothetical protein
MYSLSGGRWPARKCATSDPTVRQRMNARTVIVGSSARLSWMAMRQPIRFGGACQGRIG